MAISLKPLYLLACYIISSTFTYPTTKFDLIFSQLYEPYEAHLTSFSSLKDDILGTFQALLIDKSLLHYEEEDHIKPSRPFPYASQNISTDFTLPELEDNQRALLELKDNERALSPWCFFCSKTESHGPLPPSGCYNGGFKVNATSKKYICDLLQVSKEGYMARNGEGCEVITGEASEVCYCPHDYYGPLCAALNELKCDAESLTFPPDKCPNDENNNTDSKYYAYSIGNKERPCYYVEKDATVEMSYKLNCHYHRPYFAFEGIKMQDSLDYEPVEEVVAPFSYKLNAGKFKLTFFHPFRVRLSFIDWVRVSNPCFFETYVDGRHISNEENIVFNVTFDSKMAKKCRAGGRYYHTFESKEVLWRMGKINGVLDDASYQEPKRIKPVVSHRMVKYVGIITIIGIMAIIFSKVILKNKGEIISKITLRSVYLPLGEGTEMTLSVRELPLNATSSGINLE